MAITKVAEATGRIANGAPYQSFTIPSGVTADHLVIFMASSAAGYSSSPNEMTINGWTRVVNKPSQNNNSEWSVFWRRGVAAGQIVTPSSYYSDSAYSLVAFDTGGRDIAVVGAVGGRSGTSSATTVVPSLTTTYNNADVLLLANERTLATGTVINSISPAVTTHLFYENNTVANVTHLIASFTQASAGATGTRTITYNGASGNGAGLLLMLAEPVAAPVAPSNLRIYENGVEVQVTAYEVTAGTPNKLTCEGRMGLGLMADQLGTKPGFVVAHRGGSVDWAEMSMRSYTESVRRGADCLEFSIGLTSDGVYFGLHDQTLDRTTPSLNGQNWDPRQHTWAEVQAYQAKAGADTAFGAQPYTLLSDVLAAYGKSHCIFIDPKYVPQNQYTAMWNYIIPRVGDPTKNLMGKYFFSNATFAASCSTRGIKSWGFYYTADVEAGSHVATAANWTYVGLEYTATQATFNALASAGRPIISHICPDRAAYETAMSKGAVGVMVSGIRSVLNGGA